MNKRIWIIWEERVAGPDTGEFSGKNILAICDSEETAERTFRGLLAGDWLKGQWYDDQGRNLEACVMVRECIVTKNGNTSVLTLEMRDVVTKVPEEKKDPFACPCCGERLFFVAATDAHFTVNPDGSLGRILLDQDGIDCLYESVLDENVEFHCPKCNRCFEAIGKLDENGVTHFTPGMEL